YDVTETISLDRIEGWRAQGLRILAFRRQSGAAQPPSELSDPFQPGDAAIIAGPEEVIRRLLSAPSPALSEDLSAGEVFKATNERVVAGEKVRGRHSRR